MEGDEARRLLGFPPNSRPTPSEVKAAYRKRIWESHPDLFPAHEKPQEGVQVQTVSYFICFMIFVCVRALPKVLNKKLVTGGTGDALNSAEYSRVVRTGVPRASGGRKNHPLIKVPFILIILGTAALGVLNAARAYKRQKEDYPSHNPFLP